MVDEDDGEHEGRLGDDETALQSSMAMASIMKGTMNMDLGTIDADDSTSNMQSIHTRGRRRMLDYMMMNMCPSEVNIMNDIDIGGADSTLSPLLRLPGRETAAGRALFALFKGYDIARKRGNQYSHLNAIRIRRHQLHKKQQQPSPDAPDSNTHKSPLQKRCVKVPRFRKKLDKDKPQQTISIPLGRRPASEILKQLKYDLKHKELPPFPTKPLLDDNEKKRLALLFEWSGRIDKEELMNETSQSEVKPTQLQNCKVVQLGSLEEMEILMDRIAKEIEDREDFIKEMEKFGQSEKYKNQLCFEIQQRVKQMKKLDQLIKEEHDKGE